MYRYTFLKISKWMLVVILCCLAVALGGAIAGRSLASPALTMHPTAAQAASASACWPWVQVNQGAFGLGAGPDGGYNNEEGFEVQVFKDQLYLGMEADNTLGARLWRSREGVGIPNGQADWEEVIADQTGLPFGVSINHQNDHIDSLAELGGYLYVSTANTSSYHLGTRIFRSQTGAPGSWEDAITAYGAGFGDGYNNNFKDMQVFEGWLCGGTENDLTGGQVWCTQDGDIWVQKNNGGFGNGAGNPKIWSGYVYNGYLYFGVQNNGLLPVSEVDDVARLYRTSDLSSTHPQWDLVYSGAPGSYRVDLLGDLNQRSYASVRSADGIAVLRSSDGGAGHWDQVNLDGMGLGPNNLSAVVDSAALYDGWLYLAVSNFTSGFELWRTDGSRGQPRSLVNWERIGGDGLTDNHNLHAELIEFNGWLYAWTSNFVSGQQVLRSNCLGDYYGAYLPIALQESP